MDKGLEMCDKCDYFITVEEAYKQACEDTIKRIIEHIKLYEYNSGTYVITDDVLDELKNLKEKNLTCFDCKHHFMSDCYLECNKHNRINDNKICDDFEHLKEESDEH